MTSNLLVDDILLLNVYCEVREVWQSSRAGRSCQYYVALELGLTSLTPQLLQLKDKLNPCNTRC